MQSFWKTRKRSCGFVFLVASLLSTLTSPAKNQPATKVSSNAVSQGLPSQALVESLEFLNAEGRAEDFELLQNKIIPSAEVPLFKKIIEIHLENKNRSALISFLSSVSESFHCRTPMAKTDVCAPISNLWKNNLDSVYFYEESPGKVLRAKKMMTTGDCLAAQALLKEVELKEGFPRPLVDTARAIAECLGNKDAVLLYQKRAGELRVFE